MAEKTATKLQTKDKDVTPKWYVAKSVLRAKGITYVDLAERLGVSATSVHDFVNYTPNVLRIKQMAEVTGIPFFDFFDFSQEPEQETVVCTSATVRTTPKSKAIITCPCCGETLLTTLTTFNQ